MMGSFSVKQAWEFITLSYRRDCDELKPGTDGRTMDL